VPKNTDPILERIRAICLALPDTKETLTWGKPHFRVLDKIFCGYGEENGAPSVGFKLPKEVAFAIVSDPRYFRAPYVGQHGWVGRWANTIKAKDWAELKEMIEGSYRQIAPKKSLAKLEGATAAPAKAAKKKSPATRRATSTKVRPKSTSSKRTPKRTRP